MRIRACAILRKGVNYLFFKNKSNIWELPMFETTDDTAVDAVVSGMKSLYGIDVISECVEHIHENNGLKTYFINISKFSGTLAFPVDYRWFTIDGMDYVFVRADHKIAVLKSSIKRFPQLHAMQ